MKNTVLTFDKLESDNYSYSDYTTYKYKNLYEYSIPDEYITLLKLDNDAKIEYESFKLYGSPDYWDLLIVINKMDPLFSMPYNFDTIQNRVTDAIDLYLGDDYNGKDIKILDQYQYLKDYYSDKYERENEEFRTIKVIKPERLQDFLKLIRTEGLI